MVKWILRFDDTDSVVKRPDQAHAMIEDDFTWLAGREPDRIIQGLRTNGCLS